MSSTGPTLACSFCRQQFLRADHLKRHEQTHFHEQMFPCLYCGKAFSRKDAAKRHEAVHDEAARAQRTLSCPSTLNRSCTACSRFRVRCSKTNPCANCVSRGISCTYLLRKRRRSHLFDASPGADTGSGPSTGVDHTVGVTAAIVSPTDDIVRNANVTGQPLLSSGNPQSYNVSGCGFFDRLAVAMKDNPYEFPAIETDPFNDPRGINWLPFDPSLPDGFGLPGLGPVAALGSESFQPETTGESSDPLLVLDASDTPSAYGYGSSVIASTETSHVELPSVTYESPESSSDRDDSHPGLPAKLYADGDGGRACTADRAILERQASHSHETTDGESVPVDDCQPSWVYALQTKLRQFRERHRHIMESMIADTILQEARRIFLPHLQEMPSSRSCLMVMDGFLFEIPTLRFFIKTCMETFLSTYSFFDTSLLSSPIYGWALCMAVAVTGSRYLGIPEITELSDHLCLVLHRLLMDQYGIRPTEEWLPYIQAHALVTVCLCHSADSSTMSAGFDAVSVLNNHCLRLRLLDEAHPMDVFEKGQSTEDTWRAWRHRESRRRTGLFLWLLDCSLAITTQVPPRFLAIPLNLRLLCDDRLWRAESYEEWTKIRSPEAGADVACAGCADEDRSRMDIRTAVHTVQTNRVLPEPNTALGTAVLIHTLILRIWDPAWPAGAMLSQQEAQEEAAPAPPYLAIFRPYTKWRNGVCDALDVLHWDALGTSARSGGQEGPIFLQLHLARLVLLVPVRELLQHIGSFGSTTSDQSVLPFHLYDTPLAPEHCRRMLATWATKDRYKARLAVIHAAAVFWHVRRYSSDSFHQPLAVYLAAATLWAFGCFSAPTVARQQDTVKGSDVSCTRHSSIDNGLSGASLQQQKCYRRRMPKSILIDRPIDDELVQYFIRAGDNLVLMLEGVDNLYAADGPEQVLRDGAMLLDGLRSIWPVAENYRQSLEAVFTSRP